MRKLSWCSKQAAVVYFFYQSPWDTDVKPWIICVLKLKFEKAVLKMRCLPLSTPNTMLKIREIAGTRVQH